MSEKLNKSIEILEKTAKNIEDKKISEKKKENQERGDLTQKIRELRTRITDLIEAGQKCQELGIDFPTKNEMLQFGYDSRFEADGVNHDLGFITKEFKIRYLGIKNGGFNGPWDFYTDGTESFSVANKDYLKGATGDPQIQDMKKFLKQFEVFESAFYQWIDSLNRAEEADSDECVKRISLRNLYENGIKSLTFGTGEIVLRDGRYVLEHNALPFIEDGEELRFQFFADAGEGERFALGTSKEEHGVYLTKEEYELAVENPAFPENIRKHLKYFKENGKTLKYLINYIPDNYFDEQKIIAELTGLGFDAEEVIKCLEHDFGLDMKKISNENTYANLESSKTYKFAGYDWTACEVDNKRHVAVIQSHGVTHGEWPGYKMPQFGNGNYYTNSIDGHDISAYDNKMKELYDAIKDVEDTSASFGKGLYLISKEKAGYTAWGEPGSGNYCQALKATAKNARSFGAASDGAWLGTVGSSSSGAWCVGSGGYVYGGVQNGDFVVAPAFNLDLSKVEVVGDEIVIKEKNAGRLENQPGPAPYRPYRSIWEYGMDFNKDGQTVRFSPEMVRLIYEAIKEDNGRKCVATFTNRKFTTEQYIAVCEEVENLLAENSGDTEYRACEHVLGVGFDKK